MSRSTRQAPNCVLHIEDDKVLAASVAMLLRTVGYASEAVASGEEALAWVNHRKDDLDVLIVDFELAGELDGSDVAQEIFRILGRPVPTIMLSGRLTEITPPWMPGAPLLCLWKPVEPDVLVKAVETFAAFGGFLRRRPKCSAEQEAVSGYGSRQCDH